MKRLRGILGHDAFQILILAVFCLLIIGLSLRGHVGNPTQSDLNTSYWKENGPFELSPERGRFALTYALVENHTFDFSRDMAFFASPDVATHDGKFVSLFAPLLSILAVPGYMIGKAFGASQVGAFAMIGIFAVMNVLLIRALAVRLGAHPYAASLAGALFLFGTPAYAYAVNLYQHHVSTFLVLVALYALVKSSRPWTLLVVFIVSGLAISLDYPNFFMFFPLGLYALGGIFTYTSVKNTVTVTLSYAKAWTPLILIVPMFLFFYLNFVSYGNPLQLAGTLPTAQFEQKKSDIASVEVEKNIQKAPHKKSAVGFFKTRNLLNGFYIEIFSPDRGIIMYAPFILSGFLGMVVALRRKVPFVSLIVSIIGVNFILYALWGDPWGGWAFGSRYLIPSYALLSILIALLLTKWRHRGVFIILFAIIAFYSVAVNTLGALTTSAIPPQVQVLELEKISGVVQKYTPARNWDMIKAGSSKSFVFEMVFSKHISAFYYYVTITLVLITGMWLYMLGLLLDDDPTKKKL